MRTAGRNRQLSIDQPELLLMDEPLASPDDKRKSEVLPFIVRLPREFGARILYVTRSLPEIQVHADRVVLVENGSGAVLENPEPS